MPAPGVKDSSLLVCEEEAIFSASEEKERRFKAGKLHNSITFFFFFTKTKRMFLFFL